MGIAPYVVDEWCARAGKRGWRNGFVIGLIVGLLVGAFIVGGVSP